MIADELCHEPSMEEAVAGGAVAALGPREEDLRERILDAVDESVLRIHKQNIEETRDGALEMNRWTRGRHETRWDREDDG